MILEVAEIHANNGQQTQFEHAMAQSMEQYISVTEGFINGELRRSMESPTRYLLLIQWATLEAHNVNFRESDRFPLHRELISPYFAKAPMVEHFVICT